MNVEVKMSLHSNRNVSIRIQHDLEHELEQAREKE